LAHTEAHQNIFQSHSLRLKTLSLSSSTPSTMAKSAHLPQRQSTRQREPTIPFLMMPCVCQEIFALKCTNTLVPNEGVISILRSPCLFQISLRFRDGSSKASGRQWLIICKDVLNVPWDDIAFQFRQKKERESVNFN
jgi:hypothetical protein